MYSYSYSETILDIIRKVLFVTRQQRMLNEILLASLSFTYSNEHCSKGVIVIQSNNDRNGCYTSIENLFLNHIESQTTATRDHLTKGLFRIDAAFFVPSG